jgi:uncharacterized protein YbaP (TraB family)
MLGVLTRRLGAVALAMGLSGMPAMAQSPAVIEPPAEAPATLPVPAGEPESLPAPDAREVGTPAIWTITKPGGGTITLFGSVHLLPRGMDWHTPALSAALERADTVVFETPLDGMESPEMASYLQAHIMNPPGVTLSSLLSADEKAQVEAAARQVGVSVTALEAMRPWFVALQMGVLFVVNQGFDPNSGVDKKVEAEAKAKGKQLDHFETTKEQLAIFTDMTPDQEKAFLLSTAKDIIQNPGDLSDMVEAWYGGDVAGLDRLMNASLEAYPDLAKVILHDRNARWVEKITGTYMGDGKTYLIVVGAAHLAGSHGVPEMLRARGISVDGP